MLDFDDVVQRVDDRGARRRVDLATARGVGVGGPGGAARGAARGQEQEKPPASAARRFGIVGVAALAFFLITAVSPPALIGHLVVFALAIVIGYYVIGNVHHALHTPLMSVTNAISGIILVGALLQIGQHSLAITIVATVAILLATINVFGGFAVTRRMLGMFRRS